MENVLQVSALSRSYPAAYYGSCLPVKYSPVIFEYLHIGFAMSAFANIGPAPFFRTISTIFAPSNSIPRY